MGLAYDVRAPDLDTAKEHIRAHLKVKRLPRNTEVWECRSNSNKDPVSRAFNSIRNGG
jgi:hypothetical protein